MSKTATQNQLHVYGLAAQHFLISREGNYGDGYT